MRIGTILLAGVAAILGFLMMYMAVSYLWNMQLVDKASSIVKQHNLQEFLAITKIELLPGKLIAPSGLYVYEVKCGGAVHRVDALVNMLELPPGVCTVRTRAGLIVVHNVDNFTWAEVVAPLVQFGKVRNVTRIIMPPIATASAGSATTVSRVLVPLIVQIIPPGRGYVDIIAESGYIVPTCSLDNLTKSATVDKVTVRNSTCILVPRHSVLRVHAYPEDKNVGILLNMELLGHNHTYTITIDAPSILQVLYGPEIVQLNMTVLDGNIKNSMAYTCVWKFPGGKYTWSGVVKGNSSKVLTVPVGTVCKVATVEPAYLVLRGRARCGIDTYFIFGPGLEKGKCDLAHGKATIAILGNTKIIAETYKQIHLNNLKIVLTCPSCDNNCYGTNYMIYSAGGVDMPPAKILREDYAPFGLCSCGLGACIYINRTLERRHVVLVGDVLAVQVEGLKIVKVRLVNATLIYKTSSTVWVRPTANNTKIVLVLEPG